MNTHPHVVNNCISLTLMRIQWLTPPEIAYCLALTMIGEQMVK